MFSYQFCNVPLNYTLDHVFHHNTNPETHLWFDIIFLKREHPKWLNFQRYYVETEITWVALNSVTMLLTIYYKLSHKREWNTEKDSASASHIQRGRKAELDVERRRAIFFRIPRAHYTTNLSSSLTCSTQGLKFQNVISRRTACAHTKFRM